MDETTDFDEPLKVFRTVTPTRNRKINSSDCLMCLLQTFHCHSLPLGQVEGMV